MNSQLCAALPRILGADPSCIVTVKEASYTRRNGSRPTHVHLNHLSQLENRDIEKAMRLTITGRELSDAEQGIVATALSSGKDVSLAFNHGFVAALDFLREAYDVAERVAA